MKTNILVLTLVILTVSCEIKQMEDISDEITYDTIKPKSYYPVYPGSWWKYVTDDSTIIVNLTSDSYELHSYRNVPYYADSITYSDSVYVPFFNSEPIYGYDKIEYIADPFGNYFRRWPILRETVGFQFHRSWMDVRYNDLRETVVVTNKFYNGEDSVLTLKGYWKYDPNKKNIIRYQDYIKGVGLVKATLIDTLSNDTIYAKHLIDYFINN